MSKKKQLSAELAAEAEEWKDYLEADLRERVAKNGGKPLSARQLKKTTNGDATYERLVRILGGGDPGRLQQLMLQMVREYNEAKAKQEECFEKAESFEVKESFETEEYFEPEEHFEGEASAEVAEITEKSKEVEASREASQLAAKPKRQKWDKEGLLAFLRGKHRELGRVPTSTEIAKWSKEKLCPSYPTCMKLLEVESKAEWKAILLREECA